MTSTPLVLGRTGITTSTLALGCARIGSALTPLGRRDCVRLIEAAFELGVRHFDTANVYGQGDSERYLGEALERHRDRVCLSSKAGQRLSPAQLVMSTFKTPLRWLAARHGETRRRVSQRRAQGLPRDFDPARIEASLHASLRRLRTDHLDIFYLHSPGPAVLDDAALMERLERLRERGLFRAFGVSCDAIESAWQAAAHPMVQVVQFEFDEAGGPALLRELARCGKLAVLRGCAQHRASARQTPQELSERIGRTLALPAIGGLLVGTTQLQHLRENVEAFRRAAAEGALR
jgi:aryl-alcohol dehydrogenase-like predicted oxidoreductase